MVTAQCSFAEACAKLSQNIPVFLAYKGGRHELRTIIITVKGASIYTTNNEKIYFRRPQHEGSFHYRIKD